MSRAFDVAVVGAGFTGLSAAQTLARAGFTVLLLEAQGRVGGRVKGGTNSLGETYDLGGQFLCEEMTTLSRLVQNQGKRLVAPEGLDFGVASQGDTACGDTPVAAAFDRAQQIFAELRAGGGEGGGESALDRSLAKWIGDLGEAADVETALRSYLSCIYCQDLADIPLWHVIEHGRRSPVAKNEMQYVVAEGLFKVAEGLAAESGAELRLDCPVTAIEWGAEGVRLLAAGRDWRAREAILALPPPTLKNICFHPALPAPLSAAIGAYRQGDVIKFLLRYSEAFWQGHRARGTLQWLDPVGLYVGDASQSLEAPRLVGFLGGPEARRWHQQGPAAIKAALLDRLRQAFGAVAASPLSFDSESWVDEPWSGGGYSASIVVAAAKDAEALLRAGCAPLSFASTEIAAAFPGYVEGALCAGHDAAKDVLQRLKAA